MKLPSFTFCLITATKEAAMAILEAMSDSGMSEHLAGEAATLIGLHEIT
ncbi:MAG: hypothetical protein MZV70_01545 [Desulfobacterales bacterium]|nr:hypothetical protein [Desulfobacterales bacterium]